MTVNGHIPSDNRLYMNSRTFAYYDERIETYLCCPLGAFFFDTGYLSTKSRFWKNTKGEK